MQANTDPRQPLAKVKTRELENSRLVILENEINQLKRTTAINMLEIGDRLIEAKAIIPYGEWEKWLCENVQLSKRTARNLMRAAKIYQGEERQALADLEITKLYYLAELSEEKRQALIENADIKSMTTREVKEVVQGGGYFTTIINDDFHKLNEEILASGDLERVTEWRNILLWLAQEMDEILLEIESKISELENK